MRFMPLCFGSNMNCYCHNGKSSLLCNPSSAEERLSHHKIDGLLNSHSSSTHTHTIKFLFTKLQGSYLHSCAPSKGDQGLVIIPDPITLTVFFRGIPQFLQADGGTVVRLFSCTSADPTGRIYLKFDTGDFMNICLEITVFFF